MSPLDRLRDLTRPTGEEQLLDVAYPAPRLHLSLRHAVFAALAVVIAVAGMVVVQSRDTPEPAFELPAVETASTESDTLVVAVVGAVAQPGLQTLAAGSRVNDALAQAQPLPEADLIALNLAQKLSDGQQLVVPVVGQAQSGEVASSGGVSLNSADAAALESLPGVGPATAAAIIAHREATGGFASIEQLMDVKGIGPAKFESLREQVTL